MGMGMGKTKYYAIRIEFQEKFSLILKIVKQQRQNIPMNVVQKKEKQTFILPNFLPQILPDEEIEKGMTSFNSKQR